MASVKPPSNFFSLYNKQARQPARLSNRRALRYEMSEGPAVIVQMSEKFGMSQASGKSRAIRAGPVEVSGSKVQQCDA
jgi:hypothetical protein